MSNEMESVNITDSSLSSRPENGQETPSHDGIHSQADFPTPSTSSNADTVASPSPSEETQSSQKTKDDANRQYACSHPNCNRRFIREYTRRVHELTHAPKARSPFICSFPNCNGRFSRQHDRLRCVLFNGINEVFLLKTNCLADTKLLDMARRALGHAASVVGISRPRKRWIAIRAPIMAQYPESDDLHLTGGFTFSGLY